MVKELTETAARRGGGAARRRPRLASVGAPGASSFDVQVRAAASLLTRMVEGGQRCSLVMHGQTRRRIRIRAGGGDWGTALAALAAVRADATRPLSTMLRDTLGDGAADAVDAARLYVVTAALSPALAERLLALRSVPPRRGRRVGRRADLRRRAARARPGGGGGAAAGPGGRAGRAAARGRRRGHALSASAIARRARHG